MVDLQKSNEADDFDINFNDSELSDDNELIGMDVIVETDEELLKDAGEDISAHSNISNDNINVNTEDNNQRSEELSNYILYIVADKTSVGELSYFRYYGLNVTKIFTDIREATDELLIQIEPCKIVIIDSGTGRFASTSSRKLIMELLSISDISNKIEVFYTDSVLKSEANNTDGVDTKDITWVKYKNRAGVVAKLLQESKIENYVYDIKDEEEIKKSEDILKFTGAKPKGLPENDIGIASLLLYEIIQHEGDNVLEQDRLEEYTVKI